MTPSLDEAYDSADATSIIPAELLFSTSERTQYPEPLMDAIAGGTRAN